MLCVSKIMDNLDIRILDYVNKEEWDKRLKASPLGGFHQTSINAGYLEKFYCYKPIYIIAEDSKKEIKGSLLLFKAPCSTKIITLLTVKRVFSALFKKITKMTTWRSGPVAFNYEDYPSLLKAFLGFIETMQRNGEMFNVRMATLPFYQLNDAALAASKNIFMDMNYHEVPKATVFIDLSLSREALWKDMKKSSRYDVTNAKKDGISVSILEDSKDLSSYYSAYKEACFRNRVMPYPQGMMLYLLEHGGRLFVALRNSRLLAGALSVEFNGIADQRFLWNSMYAIKNKLFAMHLVTWSMIEYYKHKGCRLLDLVGVNIKDDRSGKDEGILRFKTRWGGRIINYSEFEQARYSAVEKVVNKLKEKIRLTCN